MARVSVVIPAYNRAHLLEGAAATVLEQTFTDLELIIVDDGSQDRTRDVCERLCQRDRRVRYVHQDNKGPNAARNTGIACATGDYVAFLDSDDLWEPTKLAKQLAVADQDATVGVVYSDWAALHETGQLTPAVYVPELGRTTYESLLYYNVVRGSASAVLIRMECFDRVGLFDESLHRVEDWEMWLRLAQHYQFVRVPEALVYLLQHGGQSQRDHEGMADDQLRLLSKITASIPPQYRHHLATVQWHHRLIAGELYCATARRKCWQSLALAVRTWPAGILSPRPWYILSLSLTGPLYPVADAVGQAVRKQLRHHLKVDSVTGWRGNPVR